MGGTAELPLLATMRAVKPTLFVAVPYALTGLPVRACMTRRVGVYALQPLNKRCAATVGTRRFVWERIQQRVILLSMGNSVLSKWLFRCRASALPVPSRARTHARNDESVRPIE